MAMDLSITQYILYLGLIVSCKNGWSYPLHMNNFMVGLCSMNLNEIKKKNTSHCTMASFAPQQTLQLIITFKQKLTSISHHI